MPKEKRRNPNELYNPMTIQQLSENYTSIPWKEYFNTILEPNVEVDEDEIVIVNVPSFFKEFEKLMAQTPKRIHANYVMWRAVADSVEYLSDEVRRRKLKFLTEVIGKAEREARWKECVDFTSKNLQLSVGALFVRKYFNEEGRKGALEMVFEIRQTFESILKKVSL